ncbi:GNAT family N-acetyltransferase [Pontibacter burrus]|uniref:GNAT family N-acetyltransferase n=1 Tax=Pontibacter burrus TaxID=2704466 RepID=A0A6B3LHH6_9BACT|nr:GNAT family N-acetyltransferase [Pontibacter burrus]NEM96462.1 GNAT family N-acetyltransferase [Pontibacter burrus]
MAGIRIRALSPTEQPPMHLLLLADPSEELVLSYLHKSRIFVAEKAGTIVGVLVLQPQGQQAEIMNIAVAEQQQGQGIGRLLLKHAIMQASKQKIKQLVVCTGNSSLPALSLYQGCGFSVVSIDEGYFLRAYPEPIFENGLPCTDRIKLRLEL